MKPLRIAALLACTMLALPAHADDLADGFDNPPQTARPRVWWHWLNGNITTDGIDKDLDWMARMGIGGVQNFDASLQTPQIVDQRLVYMTPPWQAAFRHAVQVADAKGLEFAIAASPGWSETGGPWVKPEDGMKKLVWAQTDLRGGARAGKLPMPPATTGAFQSAAFEDPLAMGAPAATPPHAYGDAMVLAYPVTLAALPTPRVTQADGSAVAFAPLTDDDLDSAAQITVGTPTAPGALLLDYGKPVTVRSASLYVPHARPPFGESPYLPTLEAETASGWQTIGQLPLTEASTTIAFAPVTARRFRVVLIPNKAVPPALGTGEGAPGAITIDIFGRPPAKTLGVGNFRLSGEAKVDRFEVKAGFAIVPDYNALEGTASPGLGIDPTKVIDLTTRLRPNGTLDWIAPKGGDWRIVRLGYSLTGTTNHPATPEATGLEVDKYDAAAVRRYMETYLGKYQEAVGADWIGKRGVRAIVTDSIEVGPSNWTPGIVAAFKARRGYDPTPFLPTLTGAVVGSPARSDAFLHDYRATLADLLADAHYGTVAKVAHEHGLTVYGEALENGRPVLGDDLAMREHTDVPMAALWAFNHNGAPRWSLLGDMKGAASVAHLYGQNIVSAESMTSAFAPWAFAPADLKHIIDLEFVSGVNRPIVHTSVHSPGDDKQPGLSLLIFGQYFNRHDSWAEMAKPWVDYISRTGFLLQQGRDHSDVAWFYGEDAPITALFANGIPAGIPTHYGYDFVNADILANRMTVKDGDLVATGGARYKALYLGGSSKVMSMAVLRRIATLVDAGATVIGEAPTRSPAFGDDTVAFAALVKRIWDNRHVIAASEPEAALARIGVVPDFSVAGGTAADYAFLHRSLPDGELYFVRHATQRSEYLEARFRVTGKQPEIWRAIDGTAVPVSYRTEGNDTVIPLDVGPEDAFFVLFRKPAGMPAATVPPRTTATLVTLTQPWTVNFQPNRGAPGQITMQTLQPLDQSTDEDVRCFSGIATYTSRFALPKNTTPGAPLWLDLGKIGDMAEVSVNGQRVGTTWIAPYQLDIGKFAHNGSNTIEVRVANLWVNRLIGDQQPGAKKVTFTAAPTYRPDAPLRPSGLIGPVTLSVERNAPNSRNLE